MKTTHNLSRLPACQAKEGCREPARIDCPSWTGRWGYTCLTHWPTFRMGRTQGTFLLLPHETDADVPRGILDGVI